MTNEQREAIELAKEFTKMDFSNKMGWTGYYDAELKELSQAIDTVLSLIKEQQEKIAKYEKIYKEYDCYRWVKELDKKDKIIDLMAEYINEIDVSEDICEGRTMCDEDCEKCIKQYFAGLVEKE